MTPTWGTAEQQAFVTSVFHFYPVHLILYLSLSSISFCVSQKKPKEEIAKLKSSTLAALTWNFSSFTIRAVLKFKCIIVKYVCRKTNVVITNHKSLIYKRIHMALRSHLIYKVAICPTWMQILTTGKQSHMNQFTLDAIISFPVFREPIDKSHTFSFHL